MAKQNLFFIFLWAASLVPQAFVAVVENLFNNHYEEFSNYNTAKRRARLNLTLNF